MECTNDLDLVVAFYMRVFNGEPFPDDPKAELEGRATSYTVPTLEQRERAAQWLTDRGIGKAPQVVELDTGAGDGADFRSMGTDDLKRLVDLLGQAGVAPTEH